MKPKKTIALLISAVLLVTVFSGCNQTAKSPFVSGSPSPAASASPGTSPASSALNLAGAYKSLDPKTVMVTINGKNITWDELFYYIDYTISQIQADGGQITSWSAIYQGETTYKDFVLNSAVKMALQNAAVEYGADKQKISLSQADQTAIQADWDSQVKAAGSEEALLSQLQAQYSSKDIYTRLQNITYLAQDCFAAMYGDKGSKLSDSDVADATANDGYLMAKHILMLTSKTDEAGNSTPMSDADKAAVKQKMEDILNQLKSYKGNDFNGYFDQLMNQNSEDKGGLAQFPKGYLFQSGDMVSQFEDGTKALKVGEFSQELVQTDYGYHIIYRIPINYDITPMKYANYGAYSLRYITALNQFKAVVDTWVNSLTVSYSDKYKALDFNKMFAAG